MPRPSRLHVAEGFYHVVLRGNHRQPIFATGRDRDRLDDIVAAALPRYRARLHAYCWMTNHLHLVLQVGDVPLGRVMQFIASGYARAFQRRLETTGHLFERRYHAWLVDHDEYLLTLVRYVHLNPVRAGLVADPSEYPWSAHRHYLASGEKPDWLTTDFVLGMFSRSDVVSAVERYHCFVLDAVGRGRDPSMYPCRPGEPLALGSTTFLAALKGPAAARTDASSHATGRSLEEVAAAVAAAAGMTVTDLRSPARDRRASVARALFARRACEESGASFSTIGRYLGRSTAAVHALVRRRRQVPE